MGMVQKILVVDDEASQRATICHVLSKKLDYHPIEMDGGKEAIKYLENCTDQPVDLMLLDMSMPEMDGIEVIRAVRAGGYQLPIVVLSMYGSLERAVEAVRAGADDFLAKPVTLARLQVMLQTHLKMHGLISQLRRREDHILRRPGFSEIIHRSERMREAVGKAKEWVNLHAPVLISAEAGSGKTLLAMAMCEGDAQRPVQEITLKPGRWREELSSAVQQYCGAVLLVDLPSEINLTDWKFLSEDIPAGAESKHVQLRYMRRLAFFGAESPAPMRHEIHLPPLRMRNEDIIPLANVFLRQFAAMERCTATRFDRDTLEWMAQQPWPGNVREMAHLIYRAVICTQGNVVRKEDLNRPHIEQSQRVGGGPTLSLLDERGKMRSLCSVENEMIVQALSMHNGCLSKAARSLDIGRTTLYRKLSQMGLGRNEMNGKKSSKQDTDNLYI